MSNETPISKIKSLFKNKTFSYSFSSFFFLLFAYYLLRPVRETMGTVYGEVHDLFLYVFLIMLVLVPVFGVLVSKYKRQTLIKLTTRFFSLCLIIFSASVFYLPEIPKYLAASFFVWLSIYSLFTVSLFWSLMADIFSASASKKYFAAVAAGGSLGGMLASYLAANFSSLLGLPIILFLPVLFLELYLCSITKIEGTLSESQANQKPPALKNPFAGFSAILNNRYLLLFALFMVIGKFSATMVYLQMLDIVALAEPVIEKRTAIFAWENLIVQILAFIFQIYLTSIILKRIGLSYTLMILPLALAAGYVFLRAYPVLWVVFTLQVTIRFLSYGVAKPAKEILFTAVSREEKYKAKNFLDTAGDRGADALSSKFYTFATVGLADEYLLYIIVALALSWSVIAWLLGEMYERKAAPL